MKATRRLLLSTILLLTYWITALSAQVPPPADVCASLDTELVVPNQLGILTAVGVIDVSCLCSSQIPTFEETNVVAILAVTIAGQPVVTNILTQLINQSAASGSACSITPPPTVLAPTISKTFGAGTIVVGASTSLSFTVTNPAANTGAVSGVGFTDTLPAGLVVATPNGTNGSCGGGTITAMAGSNSISLSGATLAANANCTFSVNVTATMPGTRNNKTGAVNSTEGGSGGTASASINVVPPVSITSLTATPNTLWPPNHQMVPVTLSPTTSGGAGPISCMITSVSSNEPVDPDGDWQITGNLTLNLRADRLATRKVNSNGRVYSITVQCGDGFSSAVKTTAVLVPHDLGQ